MLSITGSDNLGRGPNLQSPDVMRTLSDSYLRVTFKPHIGRSELNDQQRSDYIDGLVARLQLTRLQLL